MSFEEARRIVEEHAERLRASRGMNLPLAGVEIIDLPAARGRVLVEPVVADRDFPPFARATRDGYAVRAADVERVPARLEVIGEIKAGDSPENYALKDGQTISIMTGAPLPPGADAVVMVEYARRSDRSVEIQRTVRSGENFVLRGAEAKAGQILVECGRRLDHLLIAIAAAVGKKQVKVFRRPRVAVLATGDELVELDATLGAAQIRNSNSYSLTAQIEDAGGEATRLSIARDEPAQLRVLIQEGLAYDLLLLAGGVSMGKYDLVEQVLTEMSAEFYFTGASIQPGKPIVFGSVSGEDVFRPGASHAIPPKPSELESRGSAPRYFFGLPGNPVSTMVTFRLFVQPMMDALAGARAEPLVFLKAKLKTEIRSKTGLTRFLPAVVLGEFENSEIELVPWQGSGDIAALARANCYAVIPPDRERIAAGEWVSVLLP